MDYCIRAKVRGIVCFSFGMTLRDGNREYFYAKLDEHFPWVKQQYIRSFGGSYECLSPNNHRLMEIFTAECRKHGILYRTDDVFGYLRKFETKEEQMSLFR